MSITVLHLDDDTHLGMVNAKRVVEKVGAPENRLRYRGFQSTVAFFDHLNDRSNHFIKAQRFILDHRMPTPGAADWWPCRHFDDTEDNVGVAIAARLVEHYQVKIANILFYSLSSRGEFADRLGRLEEMGNGDRLGHFQKADIPGLMQAVQQWV